MYLERSQQKLIGRGSVALSLLLGGMGSYLAIQSPQINNARDLSTVYAAGKVGDTYVVRDDKTSFFIGLSLLVGAMGSAAVGAMTAASTAEVLNTPSTTTAQGQPIAQPDLVKSLRETFGEILSMNPWLMRFLPRGKDGSVAIVVGSSGAGKSGFVSAICLLRSLLMGHEIAILDPHAQLNRQSATWLTGTIYNASEIRAALPKLLEPREPGQKKLTIVIDEFSGWNKANGLENEAQLLVDHGIRNARKYRHDLLFCSHGREKGLFAGESLPSGMQSQLQTAAHLLEIEAGVNQWGETVWTGKAQFKLAKLDPSSEANWMRVQVPHLFNPETLRTQLQGVLDYLGMDAFYVSDDRFRLPPEMEANLEQAINASSPEFRSKLERIFGLDVELPADSLEGSDRSDEVYSELPEKLLKIVEFALKHGWVNASQIKRGVWTWRESDPSEIRAAFQTIVSFGVGRMRGTGESLEFSARGTA